MNAKTHAIISGLFLAVVSASGDEFDLAIDAALNAPRNEFLHSTPAASLTVSNHHLKLYPVFVIDGTGSRHTIGGTLVCEDARGATRHVAYRIAKDKGVIKDIQIQVDNEAPQALSARTMKALGIFLEQSGGNAEQRAAVAGALRRAMDGTWLSAVELLIAHIGMQHC